MRILPLALIAVVGVGLSAGLAGCRKPEPEPVKAAAAPPPAPKPAPTRMEGIVAQLHGAEAATRDEGVNALRVYAGEGIPAAEGLIALRAASGSYPPPTLAGAFDLATELVHALIPTPRPEYVAPIVEQFPHLVDGAKFEALDVLTRLPQREAATAYVQLLRAHALAGRVPKLPVKELQRDPRFAEVLFPELADYAAVPALSASVLELILTYANEGLIPAPTLATMAPKLIALWPPLRDRVQTAAREKVDVLGAGYQATRFEAEILIDLLGFLPGAEPVADVREALRFWDTRLELFAVMALLRRGEKVEPLYLNQISGQNELRRWLYVYLKKEGKLALMPAKDRTQAALAETDLVHWLLDTKALGIAPSKVELMKVLTLQPNPAQGPLDYYVFRYQVPPPHELSGKGWLAGVSGPFRRKDGPGLVGLGDTFSAYEPYAGKTPEQHAQLDEALQRWKEEADSAFAAALAPDKCRPEVSAHRCTVPIRCKPDAAASPFAAPAQP